MIRTQIHLSDEDVALLDRVAVETGASRSELIRRAIRAQYASPGRYVEDWREVLASTAGAWKGRTFTGEQYERAIRRGDMNENLRRIGA